MQFVPWRYISDWRCTGCGDCCKFYSVVLGFHEWLEIVRRYGVEQTSSGIDKLFIKRKEDGTCTFLNQFLNNNSCGLQYMKPKACQLWPFKVLNQPRLGYAKEASYNYGKNSLFVYADSTCNGLKLGKPTLEFTYLTLREFVEVAVGLCNNQFRTTRRVSMPQRYMDMMVSGYSYSGSI